MTYHSRQIAGGEHSIKFQVPSSYGLGVIGDMWHLTPETWYMKSDIWALCQNCRSLALMAWVWKCLEDILTKHDWLDEWINQWINCEGVCRMAPDTLNLLNSGGASQGGPVINGARHVILIILEGMTCYKANF